MHIDTTMFDILSFFTAIIIFVILFGYYQKKTNAICKSKKRLDGKTVIVTGGTTGMGLELAKDIAERGAKVIIACPFIVEGENARKTIIDNTGNENILFKLLDLGSLDSVRKFAEDILKTEDRLDILFNNAGVGIPGDFLTADGMNFIMQVNYFGHFLLTLLLLPLLKKTGVPSEPSRIVNLSSTLHLIGSLDIESYNRTNYWYRLHIYGNSKLCLALFAHKLTQMLEGRNIVINSVDPGFVGTRIYDSIDKITGSLVAFFCRHFFKSPVEGAQTALHVALDSEAGRISGGFFRNCSLSAARKAAYNDELAERLWKESLRLVKFDDDALNFK